MVKIYFQFKMALPFLTTTHFHHIVFIIISRRCCDWYQNEFVSQVACHPATSNSRGGVVCCVAMCVRNRDCICIEVLQDDAAQLLYTVALSFRDCRWVLTFSQHQRETFSAVENMSATTFTVIITMTTN